MPVKIRKLHLNLCMFDGYVLSTKYTDNPTPLLEITLDNYVSVNYSNRILIHAEKTLAQLLYPQLEKGDEIHVICRYNPLRVVEAKNSIIPRFVASKVIITEKKLSPIQLSYQEIE